MGLEILDARQFVMFANASVVTGQEVTNPTLPETPFTKERNVPIRTIPKGNADLRFQYLDDSNTLTVKFGDGHWDFRRKNRGIAVFYDRNQLPMGLEIDKAREFVLKSMESVLMQKEVSVCLKPPAFSTRS